MLKHSEPDKSSFLSVIQAVGSVVDVATLRRLPDMHLPALCDIVEFRLDAWPEHAEEGLARARLADVPVLATVRRHDEGGQEELPAVERLRLLRMFLPVARLVDIEMASLGEMPGLVPEALAAGVIVIASHHDFSGTPSLEALRKMRDTSLAAGADMVKFATTLHGAADIATLAALLEEPGHPPLSIMGMGVLGRISRLLFAQLGSILNYGWLDRPTVPGQWPAARLRDLIREL
jgi:3-dehydroquinate dehydratase I